jgi:sugar lactone lactonase YvrE
MVRTLTAQPAWNARADLGEGPAWDAAGQRLAWVDITGRAVHVHDPASGAFGGRDGDTFFVPSAPYRLSAKPRAGSLPAADIGVGGPPATPLRAG